MVNSWLSSQKDFLTGTLTTLSEPEKIESASRKIMDLSSSKNISQVVTAVQKSIKNTPNPSSWIDSGT